MRVVEIAPDIVKCAYHTRGWRLVGAEPPPKPTHFPRVKKQAFEIAVGAMRITRIKHARSFVRVMTFAHPEKAAGRRIGYDAPMRWAGRSVDMKLDDPEERLGFRKELSQLGLDEVRYRLSTGKYSKQKAKVVEQWIADSESGATIVDDLLDVSNVLHALKEQFVQGGNLTGLFLQTEDQATFERLFLEAKTLVDERLGKSNDYSRKLIAVYREGVGGIVGGPSLACLTETVEIIRGAIKQMQRRPPSSAVSATTAPRTAPYIDLSRLADIRSASSVNWDFSRLVQMCVELNIAYENRNYICVAMLVRAIVDHVPPIFQKTNFPEVANNYGGQSFKGSMKHLDESMRKIGDSYLHQQIRQKESLPSEVQVDVRRELDVLLAEVVRSV